MQVHYIPSCSVARALVFSAVSIEEGFLRSCKVKRSAVLRYMMQNAIGTQEIATSQKKRFG